jgi:methionine-rich copper-binding protein CopC
MKAVASLALFLALPVFPSRVSAHAYLVKSVPAQRATLLRAPARIQLWFNERLEPRYSSFTVSGPDGERVDIGKTMVGRDDAKEISAAIKIFRPGRYVIKYRVLSVDGHIVQDQFTFTVKQ